MTTTHDWSEPIFGLPAPRPTPWRVPALVVLGALVVGSGGMAMTTAQPEEPIVSRPARLLHTPAPMVKVEVPAPVVVGPAAPAKPMARKRQPAPDVLGDRL